MRHPFVAIVLVLCSAAEIAGCGALDPYPTVPQAVPRSAASAHRVAICYNPLSTTPAEVRAEAQQECVVDNPRTRPEPAGTDWYLENCPLLLPGRATFVCAPYR